MQWGDVPAWVAAAAAVVATIFGMLSWRSSRLSKEAEDAAKEQADRATQVAEDLAAAQSKIAADLNRLSERIVRKDENEELKPWRIEYGGEGDYDYHLVNLSKTPKYGVTLMGETIEDKDANTFHVIDGRQSVEIDVYVHDNTEDRTITVSWYPTENRDGLVVTQQTTLRR